MVRNKLQGRARGSKLALSTAIYPRQFAPQNILATENGNYRRQQSTHNSRVLAQIAKQEYKPFAPAMWANGCANRATWNIAGWCGRAMKRVTEFSESKNAISEKLSTRWFG